MTTLTLRHRPVAEATLLPDRGGLLARLKLADGDGRPVELLWLPPAFHGNESGWPGGGAPICFPFAGRVFHEGQPFLYTLPTASPTATWRMPLHGFAYALPWRLTGHDTQAAELTLASDERTRELYPFDFLLTARYELSPHALTLALRTEARGAVDGSDARMPLALGIHPFFRAPLAPSSSLAHCRLETGARDKIRVTAAGGAGKSSPFPESPDEAAARLTDKLLANLILADHAQPEAALIDADARLALRLRWESPLSYLVLWRREGEGFQCVEPWMGLPDAVHNGEGVRWLAAGESVTCRVEIKLQTTGD